MKAHSPFRNVRFKSIYNDSGAESMSRIIQVLMISQIALAAGCAFKEDTGPEKPETKPSDVIEAIEKGREAQAPELAAALKNARLVFEELPMPDQYIARLEWPPALKRVVLLKHDDNRDRAIVNGTEFTERVIGGTTVSYIIKVQDAFGTTMFTREFVETVPKDQVVIGRKILTEDTNWSKRNRVFFLKNSQILLNGFSLSIGAQKILIAENEKGDKSPSEYAHILTNEPHALVANGRVGGSIINIQAERAEGNLIVHLMGAKGLPGKSGAQKIKESGISLNTPTPDKRGIPGQPGRSRIRAMPCRGTKGDIPCDSQVVCDAAPTNGGPGHPGDPGPSGDRGGTGAKSGSIYFDVKDHSEFTATVYFTRGPGGDGGEGSAVGFVGGIGGDAGAPANGCPSAGSGPQGLRGGKGSNGAKGEEGEVGDMRGNGVNLIPIPYELPSK